MSLPSGGFDQREPPGRRRVWFWMAVGGILIVMWVGVVLGWSADPQPKQTVQNQRTDSSTVPEEPAFAQSGEVSEASTPDGAGDPVEGIPVENPDNEGAGATNEPRVYDPLGTGASADDLSQTDEARVRYAAEKFVMAAYGYTGTDEAEYLSGVAAVSLSPDLSLSPGGTEISRYARQVEESGTKSAAMLTDFDYEDTSQESVSGTALFETGEAYGSGSELLGERIYYRQELKLNRMGEAWKVRFAGTVQEAEPTNSGEVR